MGERATWADIKRVWFGVATGLQLAIQWWEGGVKSRAVTFIVP